MLENLSTADHVQDAPRPGLRARVYRVLETAEDKHLLSRSVDIFLEALSGAGSNKETSVLRGWFGGG